MKKLIFRKRDKFGVQRLLLEEEGPKVRLAMTHDAGELEWSFYLNEPAALEILEWLEDWIHQRDKLALHAKASP